MPAEVNIHSRMGEVEGWSDVHVLLDMLIFLFYMAIPAQLLFIAFRPPVVFDHRKLTSSLSSKELHRTRLLAACFAAFILSCGIGHGVTALASFTFSGECQVWCYFMGPVKLATMMSSGATSAVLQLWMPNLVSWLNDVEIHRKGFTQVLYDELTTHTKRPLHSAGGSSEAAPQIVGAACWDFSQKPEERAGLLAKPSDEPAVGLTSSLLISFCGPQWPVLEVSAPFHDVYGECSSLDGFKGMLVDKRAFSAQVSACLASLHDSSEIAGSASLQEVTLHPPGLPSMQCKADCVVKAYRHPQSSQGSDAVMICLVAPRFGPRQIRLPVRASSGTSASHRSGTHTFSGGDQACGVRMTSQHEIRHLELRQGMARSHILMKVPDLENQVVEAALGWRESELRGYEDGTWALKAFRDAADRLDVARACVGLSPLRPLLAASGGGQLLLLPPPMAAAAMAASTSEGRSGGGGVPTLSPASAVSSAAAAASGGGTEPGVDLLADDAAGLKAWLQLARASGDSSLVAGTVFVAQQHGSVFATAQCREVVWEYQPGECVTARGLPQDTNGIVVLPIEPTGAVQVGNFVVKRFTRDAEEEGGAAAGRCAPSPSSAAPCDGGGGSGGRGGRAAAIGAVAAATPLGAALWEAEGNTLLERADAPLPPASLAEVEERNFRLGLLLQSKEGT